MCALTNKKATPLLFKLFSIKFKINASFHFFLKIHFVSSFICFQNSHRLSLFYVHSFHHFNTRLPSLFFSVPPILLAFLMFFSFLSLIKIYCTLSFFSRRLQPFYTVSFQLCTHLSRSTISNTIMLTLFTLIMLDATLQHKAPCLRQHVLNCSHYPIKTVVSESNITWTSQLSQLFPIKILEILGWKLMFYRLFFVIFSNYIALGQVNYRKFNVAGNVTETTDEITCAWQVMPV